jgi:ankyrin repeat protein
VFKENIYTKNPNSMKVNDYSKGVNENKDEWLDYLRLDNPLHTACLRGQKHISIILIDMGINVNARGKSFNTALHYACSNGHVDIINLLLEQGADPLARNDDGDTPLHCACANGQTYVAILLIHSKVSLFFSLNPSITCLFFSLNPSINV